MRIPFLSMAPPGSPLLLDMLPWKLFPLPLQSIPLDRFFLITLSAIIESLVPDARKIPSPALFWTRLSRIVHLSAPPPLLSPWPGDPSIMLSSITTSFVLPEWFRPLIIAYGD